MSGIAQTVIGATLEGWRGLRGDELKQVKRGFARTLTREMCVEYFRLASSSELKNFREKMPESLLDFPDAGLAIVEATLDDSVHTREEIKDTLSWLRQRSDIFASAPSALIALCQRFPDVNEIIEESLKCYKMSVGDVRWILENTRPQLDESWHKKKQKNLLQGAMAAQAKFEEAQAWINATPMHLSDRFNRSAYEALIKLGAAWSGEAPQAIFPRVYRSGHGYWTTDPLHELDAPRGFGWEVLMRLRLPAPHYRTSILSFGGPPRQTDFSFGGGIGEAMDTYVDGLRVVLQPIAYEPESQYYLAIDIVGMSEDPMIYSIDHDGTGPRSWIHLSGLMGRLAQEL